MKLSEKQKNFINFLMYIWNLDQIFNFFLEKTALIDYVFSKLDSAKDVVS